MAMNVDAGNQLQEFAAILRRRRWQIVLTTLFVLALGCAFAVVVPKKYPVVTRVELREAEVENLSRNETPTGRETQNIQSHIRHMNRIQTVVEELAWEDYANLDDAGRFEFLRSIHDNISVQVDPKMRAGGSTFLDIEYADVDPQRAARFLERLAKLWVEEVIERDQNRLADEKKLLQNEVFAVKERLAGLTTRQRELAATHAVDITQNLGSRVGQSSPDPVHQRLFQSEVALRQVQNEIEQKTAERDALQEEYETTPSTIQAVSADGGVDNEGTIAQLELQISTLKASLEGIRPAHSRHQLVQDQIRQLEDQIVAARSLESEGTLGVTWQDNPRKVAIENQLLAAEKELRGLRAQYELLQRQEQDDAASWQQRVGVYTNLIDLQRQIDIETEALTDWEEQLRAKTIQYNSLVEAYGTPVEFVQEPVGSESGVTPNPAIIIAFSAIAGIAIGLGLALLAEFSKSCFRGASDLARAVEVPVLGVVNSIVTRAERRRKRLRGALIGTSSMILIAGIGFFAWALQFNAELLPTELINVVQDVRLSLR